VKVNSKYGPSPAGNGAGIDWLEISHSTTAIVRLVGAISFAALEMITTGCINGECVRLDGANRMAPR
jgi:hypothetical protein